MYKSEVCEVDYNEYLNIVFVKWKKFCSGNEYRKPLLYALEVIKAHKECNYAADTTDGFENEYHDTQCLLNEFIPSAAETDCKNIFFIISNDSNLKNELEGQSSELQKYFKVYTCSNIDEVRQILKK